MGNGIYFKIAGYVDLDMLHIFAIISSNGQSCSILSQKVPKFELYKHNDELLNIYYGIFYEL
jgi:hypothetical protein